MSWMPCLGTLPRLCSFIKFRGIERLLLWTRPHNANKIRLTVPGSIGCAAKRRRWHRIMLPENLTCQRRLVFNGGCAWLSRLVVSASYRCFAHQPRSIAMDATLESGRAPEQNQRHTAMEQKVKCKPSLHMSVRRRMSFLLVNALNWQA